MKRRLSLLLFLAILLLGSGLSACASGDDTAAKPRLDAALPQTGATRLPTFSNIPSATPTMVQCKPPRLITQSSGYITKITLAEDVRGNKKDPVKPAVVFDKKAAIHAVAAIKNAPNHTDFKSVWYASDTHNAAPCNNKIDEYMVSTNGTRNIDFMLKPDSALPAGTYRVEIYVNGTLDSVVNFSVK